MSVYLYTCIPNCLYTVYTLYTSVYPLACIPLYTLYTLYTLAVCIPCIPAYPVCPSSLYTLYALAVPQSFVYLYTLAVCARTRWYREADGRNASHNPFRPCQHPFPTPASSNILCREANLLQHPLPRGEPPPTSFLESRASSNILSFLSSLLVKLHANLIYSSRDCKRNAIDCTRTRITWIYCPALCQLGQAHWFRIRVSSRYTCLT